MSLGDGQHGKNVYYLAWFDDDDGGEGAAVGQDGLLSLVALERELKQARDEDRDYWVAELAAKRFCEGNPDFEFFHSWQTMSKSAYAKYKAAVLAAVKATTSAWPEWAEKALAAGWKPPKGWKP